MAKRKEKLSYQRMRALIRQFIFEAEQPSWAHTQISNYLYRAERDRARRDRVGLGLTPDPTPEERAAESAKFEALAEALFGRAVNSMKPHNDVKEQI